MVDINIPCCLDVTVGLGSCTVTSSFTIEYRLSSHNPDHKQNILDLPVPKLKAYLRNCPQVLRAFNKQYIPTEALQILLEKEDTDDNSDVIISDQKVHSASADGEITGEVSDCGEGMILLTDEDSVPSSLLMDYDTIEDVYRKYLSGTKPKTEITQQCANGVLTTTGNNPNNSKFIGIRLMLSSSYIEKCEKCRIGNLDITSKENLLGGKESALWKKFKEFFLVGSYINNDQFLFYCFSSCNSEDIIKNNIDYNCEQICDNVQLHFCFREEIANLAKNHILAGEKELIDGGCQECYFVHGSEHSHYEICGHPLDEAKDICDRYAPVLLILDRFSLVQRNVNNFLESSKELEKILWNLYLYRRKIRLDHPLHNFKICVDGLEKEISCSGTEDDSTAHLPEKLTKGSRLAKELLQYHSGICLLEMEGIY